MSTSQLRHRIQPHPLNLLHRSSEESEDGQGFPTRWLLLKKKKVDVDVDMDNEDNDKMDKVFLSNQVAAEEEEEGCGQGEKFPNYCKKEDISATALVTPAKWNPLQP